MANTTELKENWKGTKVKLQKDISSLKKYMADYKEERKSEWKSFKSKFNDDLDNVEKALKQMAIFHKK